MINPRQLSSGFQWLAIPVAAVALLLAACGPREPTEEVIGLRAETTLDDGKLVVVGARPQLATGVVPTDAGFLEEMRWDAELQSLFLKGWVPLDVRADDVRFFLRDPYDQLRLDGAVFVNPQERPDVAAAHPDQPGLRHAGFTARFRVVNLPGADHWQDTLELYVRTGAGTCHRLPFVSGSPRRSWNRARDRFELVLAYAPPAVSVPEGTTGSLDVCEELAAGTVHLTGWAPFDGAASGSTLILQLAPRLAPATIVSAAWLPRPDVRAAVAPEDERLDRAGFDVTLQFNGSFKDLKKRGALRLWCIDTDGRAVAVGLPALR